MVTPPDPTHVSDIDLYPVDEAVLDTLKAETQANPARIAALTDYDRQYVQKRLKRLAEHGFVDHVGHGLYRFKNDPR